MIYQSGSPDWVEDIPCTQRTKNSPELQPLAGGVARRERTTPSAAKKKAGGAVAHSAGGMKFGSEVHAAFEQVGWVDESRPVLATGDGGSVVAELLEIPGVRGLFERRGRPVELFREQPIDAILDGKWLSGVMDRLHLHRDISGRVTRVEVIDFKTDGLDEIDALARRYSAQMNAYRAVMERAYPGAEIECILLSTRCREWVVL